MVKKALFILVAIGALAAGLGLQRIQKRDFETLDGQAYRWQDLEGQWVFINYFAEWCAPCLKEVPELNAFSAYVEAQPGVALFAASFDTLSPEELAAVQQKYQMAFPLIVTDSPRMPNEKPRQLPATFIITPEGKVLKQLLGEQTFESLKAMSEQLQSL